MFDQEKTYTYQDSYNIIHEDKTPLRYMNNGTTQDYCKNEVETTEGIELFSRSHMTYQQSCKPNTGNAGNYYSWTTSIVKETTTNNKNEPNSVCPRNWKFPSIDGGSRSFKDLFHLAYNIVVDSNNTISYGNEDSRSLPLSYNMSGAYYGSATPWRGNYAFCWTPSAGVYLKIGNLDVRDKSYGQVLRCVAY